MHLLPCEKNVKLFSSATANAHLHFYSHSSHSCSPEQSAPVCKPVSLMVTIVSTVRTQLLSFILPEKYLSRAVTEGNHHQYKPSIYHIKIASALLTCFNSSIHFTPCSKTDVQGFNGHNLHHSRNPAVLSWKWTLMSSIVFIKGRPNHCRYYNGYISKFYNSLHVPN